MTNEATENLHLLDYWRVLSSRKEVVIAVFLLVVLSGVVMTHWMPRRYQASTVVAVREEQPDLSVWSRERPAYDPMFLRTQFELIQSRPVLEETIRQLQLDQKLGKAYGFAGLPNAFSLTYRILEGSIRAQQYRDTNLIEIQVVMSEPRDSVTELVAEVANTLASVFRNQRMKVSRDEREKALQAVLDALDAQRQKVVALEKKVNGIREQYQLDMVNPAGGSESALSKMSLQQLEAHRLRAKLEMAEKKARVENIGRLSLADLRDAAPYVVGDNALEQLVAEKRRSEVDLSKLQQAYGPKHPEVVRVDATIKELDSKINDALSGLKTGVQADYEAAKAKVEILDAELASLKLTERSAEADGYRLYAEASKEMRQAERILDSLETRYVQEKIEMGIPRTTVEFIEKAEPADPESPVSPNVTLNVILSILVGLFAGVGLAYFVEYLDTSVKSIDEVEQFLQLPVLGVIPQKVRPLTEPESAVHAEPYRLLRANLESCPSLGKVRAISCTSSSVGEGKSLTTFNLACVCAQLGDRVLLVDSDLRRPTQHRLLSLSYESGLATVLYGKAAVEDVVIQTVVPNLSFIPSGRLQTGNSHGLLNSQAMRDLVSELSGRYDWVFFDSPPVMGVSDASVIARMMTGVLLVIHHRRHPRGVTLRARKMLTSAGAPLLGVVLNSINISRDYGYSYYYHPKYS